MTTSEAITLCHPEPPSCRPEYPHCHPEPPSCHPELDSGSNLKSNSSVAENNAHFRGIKSFVKRETKLNTRVQKVWDEFASAYVIDNVADAVEYLQGLANGAENGAKYQRIVLEIGSGQGNQLVHSATNHPNTLYIGAEVYKTGVAHTLLLARNANTELSDPTQVQTILPNIKMLMCDVAELLAELKRQQITGIFDEIWTFFPDPWPKKRHHKRRLIQPDFARLIANALKSDANGENVWRIATDWEDYALYIQDVLKIKPTDRFDGRILTNFEQKGINAGRTILDFAYLRKIQN